LKGDAQTLGLLLGASGAGALISTLIVTPLLQTRRRIGRVLAACVMWSGLWWMLASLSRAVPVTMACIFMGALATPVVLTTAIGLVQTMAPPQMRGRLLSAFILVSFGIQPIASLIIGITADRFGTPASILLCGAAMIVLAAALLIFRHGLHNWVPDPTSVVEPAYGSH
jgi:predicted MFS family arabinose efflux permease